MLCNNAGIMAMHQLFSLTKFSEVLYLNIVRDLVTNLINYYAPHQSCPDGLDMLFNDAGDMAMHRVFTLSNFI